MAKISELKGLLDPIAQNLSEAAANLAEVGPQLDKATQEIKDALAAQDVEIPEAASLALANISTIAESAKATSAALKTASQTLDDLNPDKPA